MIARDEIDRAFDQEITALDAYFDRRPRQGYLGLGRQDPDMRRILEAVAFFAARTRVIARQNVRETVERLARGQLDYLLTPVPAAGLLHARVSEGLAAPTVIPRGAEIRVVAPDRTVGVFTTSRKLALFPFKLTSVERDGPALVLALDAWIPLRGIGSPIPLHVQQNGNYRDSCRLLASLAACLRGVKVSFDKKDPERATPVEWSFGAPDAAAGEEDDDGMHPIERVRSFFHFPEQDLFFNVTLPVTAKPWTSAYLYLDLDLEAPQAPELLRAGTTSFLPFVVPVTNVRRGEAEPIRCDGTKDAYPIRDGRPTAKNGRDEAPAALAGVEGVYRIDGAARTAIPPGIIADTEPVYALLLASPEPGAERGAAEGAADKDRIALEMPESFLASAPVKVSVDARWHQPSFESHAIGKLKIAFQTRRVEGVRLELVGDLEPHRGSDLADDPFALLHVLSLRTRAKLSRDELVTLLRYCGADRKSRYKRLPELVKRVTVEASVAAGGGGVRHHYRLAWKKEDPDFDDLVEDGLVRAFEDRVAALLDAWIADEVELVRQAGDREVMAPKLRPGLRLEDGGAPT